MRYKYLFPALLFAAALFVTSSQGASAQTLSDLFVNSDGDTVKGLLETFGPDSRFNAGGDTYLHRNLWVFEDANVGAGLKVVGKTQVLDAIFNPIAGYAVMIDDDLRVTGDQMLTGGLTLGGPIKNDSGAVMVDDKLNVTGSLFDSKGTLVLDDKVKVTGALNLQGDLMNTKGAVIIDDKAKITGSLNLQGSLKNTQGPVVVDDEIWVNERLGVTGNFQVNGQIKNKDGFVTVNDTLDVLGRTKTEKLTVSGVSAFGGLSAFGGPAVFTDTAKFGGGYGSTGLTISTDGTLETDGEGFFDGGLDIDGLATIASGTGNIWTDGGLWVDGNVDFADGASGDTFAIGDVGDTTTFLGDVSLQGTTYESFKLDVGSATADQDVALYFGDDGTDTAHAITWDDGDDRFEIGADDIQATSFIAGAASTTLSDGSLVATGSLDITAGGATDLTLDAGSGTIYAGWNTSEFIGLTEGRFTFGAAPGEDLALSGDNTVLIGGGAGSTGATFSTDGDLNLDGVASLDGGIDTDGAFTVANTTGDVATTGDLDIDGDVSFSDGTGGEVITIGDVGDTTTIQSDLTVDGNITGDGDVDFADGVAGDVIDIGDTGDTITFGGDIELDGTTSTTFTTDKDNTAGTEPADGAGFIIEGGSGDVGLLWNSSDNELEFTFGGGNADIQGGAASFDALDVTGSTTLGSSVDVDAETITLDADSATADVDVGIYFSDDGSGTAHSFLWDDGDARFELGADKIQATEFIAGAATTVLSDGALNSTGALEIASGGGVDLTLTSSSGAVYLGTNTNTIETGAGEHLILEASSGTVMIESTNGFQVGGGFGSTGISFLSDGQIWADGEASLDGGIDVVGVFNIDASGNIVSTGNVDFTGSTTVALGTDQVDATEIADITRTISMGLFDWRTDDNAPLSLDSATVPEPTALTNFTGLEWFSGSIGPGDGISYQFKVPEDYASGMSLHALVVDANGVADGGTDDDLTYDWYNAKAGEAVNPAVVSEGAVTAGNASTLTEVSWDMDGGTLEVDDIVRSDLYWSALDETMYVAQLWFEYTATQ